MRLASLITVVALGLVTAAPAGAEHRPDPLAGIEPLLNPEVLLQGVVREQDVSLLFAHLRAALLASYQGREAPPPEELNRRLEAISGELKARGAIAGLLLLAAFEAAARQALSEALTEPVPAAR